MSYEFIGHNQSNHVSTCTLLLDCLPCTLYQAPLCSESQRHGTPMMCQTLLVWAVEWGGSVITVVQWWWDKGGDDWLRLQSSSQSVSQSVSQSLRFCCRTDARIGLVLFYNHHQFLLDHLLISSYVIKSQTHLVRRQEILESASAAGWATKLLQSGRWGLNADNPT